MDTTTIGTTLPIESTQTVATTTVSKTTTTIGFSGDISQIHNDIQCTNGLLALLILLIVCGTGCILFYRFLRFLFSVF